tara:strand:+ start:650 stop:955 length:306 start_codon:yes stop_codon:yes gene_type:complete
MPILPFIPLITALVGGGFAIWSQHLNNESVESQQELAEIELQQINQINQMNQNKSFSLANEWNAMVSDPMAYIQSKPLYAAAFAFVVYKLFPKVKRMLKRL